MAERAGRRNFQHVANNEWLFWCKIWGYETGHIFEIDTDFQRHGKKGVSRPHSILARRTAAIDSGACRSWGLNIFRAWRRDLLRRYDWRLEYWPRHHRNVYREQPHNAGQQGCACGKSQSDASAV
jgi:hypothetical protein